MVNMINELIVGILVIFANVTLRTSGLEKNGKAEEGIPNATKWNTLTRFCNSFFMGSITAVCRNQTKLALDT